MSKRNTKKKQRPWSQPVGR